ncbi:hypothetical protein Tsubulata_006605 [Turnera subulata]|uniref:Uncharacterized protein n=1 Tax=Turnera subulata TaxID=218843 RepID=A0A9Q0FDB6_9ROSI|nr:hypothetical protein Tsubulata_006605 [Turnera subulata]
MGRGRGGEAQPELHTAARSGDLSAVISILSSNPLAVNSRDKHSRTPLVSLVVMSVLYGFVSLTNNLDRLHLAAWSGKAEVVNYLCKHKADAGAAAMDDMGAIHFASQKGHLEVVRTLLSSGVSVNASNRKGLTPLHYAVQGSYLELAKYLVKKGASLTVKTRAGKTPIDLASNEDIRLALEEFVKSSKEGNANGKGKAEEVESDPVLEDKSKDGGGEGIAREHEEQADETVKRKGEEDDAGETSSEPKRARVSLNHLLTSDDTREDDDDDS